MFNGASHIAVTGSINQINTQGSDSDPVKDLHAHVAVGCTNESDDRVDAPRCHKQTRKAVQEDIFSWMDDGPVDEILWLTGPAGTGKSAIMGTVSDKLKKNNRIAATFFFASYAGLVERTSKRGVVTTLAYQLHLHPDFEERISTAMMAAIRKDPAVFQMSLERQMEVLILAPLRNSRGEHHSVSIPTHAILIDGVDECGEAQYDRPGRSRQDDQVEVLSVLQQAIKDPAFPFRIVIASRPETWIRSFFADIATCTIKEIFLDEKYSPDDDIRLFLRSKFAELCRRYAIDPLAWPTGEVVDQLVRDASGQFIYAATILRFIDTPPHSPQEQLKIVLRINPKDRSNPFSVLDALYTSILLSSPNPSETVLWLNAVQFLSPSQYGPSSINRGGVRTSAWSIDRLLESSPGQARMLLALPSLVYIPTRRSGEYDTSRHDRGAQGDLAVGWNAAYTFYHKSFLDYLEDPSRCGAAFPGVDHAKVEKWLVERCGQTMKRGGPQVPISDPGLLLAFRLCFLPILLRCIEGLAQPKVSRIRTFFQHQSSIVFDDALLSECKAVMWLDISRNHGERDTRLSFRNTMGELVHRNCLPPFPCKPGCKLWRDAIAADEGRALGLGLTPLWTGPKEAQLGKRSRPRRSQTAEAIGASSSNRRVANQAQGSSGAWSTDGHC